MSNITIIPNSYIKYPTRTAWFWDPTAARFSTSDARWSSSCSMLFARRKGHGWTAEGLNSGCKPRPNHGLALAIPQQHIHRSSRRPGAGRCVCASGADPGELLRVPRPVFGPFGHFGNMPGSNASGGPCNCCHHILFLFSQIIWLTSLPTKTWPIGSESTSSVVGGSRYVAGGITFEVFWHHGCPPAVEIGFYVSLNWLVKAVDLGVFFFMGRFQVPQV